MALQVGELFAVLGADDSGFKKTLREANQALANAGKGMMEVGKTITASVTAPIAGLGVAALKMAGDFGESSNKVATIMDQNVTSLKDMEKGSINLSNAMGIAATEINEALYQTISATGDTANALDYVETAAKAAKGGFTDTSTAIDGLSTVMNAYGLKGTEAIKSVSDQMLMAQNFGKTTFGELSSSIGGVIPIASSLDISTQELFASLATLTKNGIGTSEAVTGMKAALSNIIKPSSEATKVAEELGLEFNAAHLKSVGWAKFLDEVRDKTGGNTETMAKLFGSVEALNSVTVLATGGAEDFAAAMDTMSSSAGATDAAFKTMEQGTKASMEKTINMAKNLGIQFGELLAPHLQVVLDKVQELITWFSGLDEETKKNIVTALGIAAAIGPVLMIVGQLVSAITTILPLITALGPVFTALTGPVGLVIAAIAGVVAIIVSLYQTNDEFKAKIDETWLSIQELATTVWGSISETITGAWTTIKDSVFTTLENIKQIVGDAFTLIFTIINDALVMIMDFWNEWGAGIFQNVVDIFTQVWEWISSLFNDLLVPIFQETLDWIEELWNSTFKGMYEEILGFVGRLATVATDIYKKFVAPIVDKLLKVLVPTFKNAFSYILDVAGTLLKGIGTVVKSIFKIFNGLLDFITGVFTGDWGKAWSGISDVFKGIVDGLVGIFTIPLNLIISGINAFIRGINRISIPDWVPGVGGKGFSISEIPMLANGGIVSGPTLAMIGEGAESEAVAPLSKLYGMIQEAVQSTAGSSISFAGIFDGAVIQVRSDNDIKAIARELYDMTKRDGRGRGY